MNKKARATLGLLIFSSSLLSCSLKSETELYTIEFYTDYKGINSGDPGADYKASDLDKTKATLVGKGYVAVNGTNKVARLTSLEKDAEGKAIEFETPRQDLDDAYDYVWDSWQGFYEDGSQVNLKEITGDCAVFAHFSAEIKTFSITIQNADSSPIFEAKETPYGSDLGKLLKDYYKVETDDEAKEALLKSVSYPFSSYYYQDYQFGGKFKDEEGNEKTADELFDGYLIKDDLKLTAVFGEPSSKKYTVTLYKDSSMSEALSSFDLTYDEAIPSDKNPDDYDDDANHKRYTFKTWKGTYGSGADVPEEIRGKEIDPSHIRYNCSLAPVFEEKPFSYKVTFLNTGKDSDPEVSADYGSLFSSIEAPETIEGLSDDKIFTGHWSTGKDAMDKSSWIDGSTPITSDLTLYPVIATKKFADLEGTKKDTFTFEYSTEWDGYLLTKFTPSSERAGANEELTEADLPLSSLPSAFPFVGISKFGTGENSYSSPFVKAVFPSSVKYVAGNAFRGNRALSTLELPGLEQADAYAFSQLYSLASFTFPSTIKSVGNSVFYMCSSLAEVKIDLTKENAAKVSFSSNWNDLGQGKKVEPTYAS